MDADQTLFLVKPDDEYCFLWPERRPKDLYDAILDCADSPRFGITADEALEVIEDLVLENLRKI